MKKFDVVSFGFIVTTVMATMYLANSSVAFAATQRFYADPDNDGYGTANDYIVREDTEQPPTGYINWITGHDNDNCPTVYNPNQSDVNNNGIGDACDPNTDPVISLLNIDLNKIAPLGSEISDDFYIGSIEYPTVDFDSQNAALRPANKIMLEALYSYYRNTDGQDFSVSLRLYDSILDAKAMFDFNNTAHTRTVINLSASERFGDDVFCHTSPTFTEINAGRYYYICGLRYRNLFVLVQSTSAKADYVPSHQILKTVYNSTVNYNPNRLNPVLGSNVPPIDTTNKLSDLVIEQIRIGATTHSLKAIVKNNSDIALTQPFGIKIVNKINNKSWQQQVSYAPTSPLLPGASVLVAIAADLPNGVYDLEGTVDYINIVQESNELNNTRLDRFTLDLQNESSDVVQLQNRIKGLSYTVAPVERDIVDLETQLVRNVDRVLVNKLKGRILLQVEGNGEAWYVDDATEQKFYLKDGSAAYQALKAFGLGISNSDIVKIPVGIEARFEDTDSDADGLSDKLEEALGTDINNPDTDHDGFADGEEVRSNHNPLGTGTLPRDINLANRLKGKILIQTGGKGQAWYVSPTDGKRYYMKDGDAAYQIMRYLSLGITNENLRRIKVGSFE